jgi:D-alanyl-lipoteichoic acid acyltransferase DltB (MBOAT superfamily)
MLFNSVDFGIFLIIVFVLYWFVINKKNETQNLFLLTASYFFYAFWDWRLLFLLILLSLANYFIGIQTDNSQVVRRRKIWLFTGLVINLGVLGVFKYYNFFVSSFVDMVSLIGYDLPLSATKIILPVGISFYTFLSLSYIIDIYKRTLKAETEIVNVLLAFSFFPIVFAGPIQRPVSLLPQIKRTRQFSFDQAMSGLWQALWGLFTKVVIADNLALLVDDIFDNFTAYSGSTLALGALFFTIQIYADFSGYSSMAIGIGKLFGFSLMKNFAFPYFSRDIAEFWKRWHISLTEWFRDYLFLPLSLNLSWKIKSRKFMFVKKDLLIYINASLVVWFLTGLWHGAGYTFIIWGLIHGFFLVIHRWMKKPRKKLLKKLSINNKNKILVVFETLFTLFVVIISWVFFRADTIRHAILYFDGIIDQSLFSVPRLLGLQNTNMMLAIMFITGFLLLEWKNRRYDFVFEKMQLRNNYYKIFVVFVIVILIYFFSGESLDFIYFKF